MIVGGILRTTFSVHKPLTGEPMNSDLLVAAVVYNNGGVIAPAAPPAIANLAAGTYTLAYALTVANGHLANDFVTITVQVSNDGAVVTVPVWQGNLVAAYADVVPLLNQTLYPVLTTHRPSDGVNQAPDNGAVPTIAVYQNLLLTGIAPLLINPAVGIYIVPLFLDPAAGWVIGDSVDLLSGCTVDGIPKNSWVFTDNGVVAAVGGGGATHHEVIDNPLRMT